MGRQKAGRTTMAALMLLVFALLGATATLVTDRFGAKVDFTEQRLYTLSQDTRALLSQLDAPVTLTVMNAEAEYPLLPYHLLKSYPPLSNQVTLRFCDPYLQPGILREYESMGYQTELNDLLVESGGRSRQIKLSDMFEMNAAGDGVERLLGEQKISSAIAAVTREDKPLVLFTDGHGEQPSTALRNLFTQNHYQTTYSTLSVLGIEEETALLVVCAPERDFSAEDIEQIESYLAQGGSLMAFLPVGSAGLSRLAAFLEDWGIGLTDEAVSEPRLYVSGSPRNVAATYLSHEINAYFAGNRAYVILPACAALKQAYVSMGNTQTQLVLSSSGSAFVDSEASGLLAPFGLVVTSERASGGEEAKEGRILVCGSKLMYGDDLLSQDSLANLDFLAQATAWCVGEEVPLAIPARNVSGVYLPMVAGEARLFAALFLGVLPLGLLLYGGVVWFRRRRL